MDTDHYKERFGKYLFKNKRLLEQIKKYEMSEEQEVRFIGIEISNNVTDEEYQVMHDILIYGYDSTAENTGLFPTHTRSNVLETLWKVHNKYLKLRELKKHKNLRTIAELKHEQLVNQMKYIVRLIRGENTILNFELAYVGTTGKSMKYILQLRPPDEDHNFFNYNTASGNDLFWDINDHNNEHTLSQKWISGNHAWKWNSETKVWMTNDIRPWYFQHIPALIYIKSIPEWNTIITDVLEEEKRRHAYLLYHENANQSNKTKIKTKPTNTENKSMTSKVLNYIGNKLFSRGDKVHITDGDESTDATTAPNTSEYKKF